MVTLGHDQVTSNDDFTKRLIDCLDRQDPKGVGTTKANWISRQLCHKISKAINISETFQGED